MSLHVLQNLLLSNICAVCLNGSLLKPGSPFVSGGARMNTRRKESLGNNRGKNQMIQLKTGVAQGL